MKNFLIIPLMVCNILFFLWLIFLGFLFFTADSDVITYEYSTYKRLQESTEKIANKGFVPLFLPEQSNSISVRFNIDTNFIYGQAKLNFKSSEEELAFEKDVKPFYSSAEKNGFSYITKDFDVFIDKRLKFMLWSSKSHTTED